MALAKSSGREVYCFNCSKFDLTQTRNSFVEHYFILVLSIECTSPKFIACHNLRSSCMERFAMMLNKACVCGAAKIS